MLALEFNLGTVEHSGLAGTAPVSDRMEALDIATANGAVETFDVLVAESFRRLMKSQKDIETKHGLLLFFRWP